MEDEEEDVRQSFPINNDKLAGQHVKKQLSLWDMLIEWRIGMQKLLVATNRLPQKEKWQSISQDKTIKETQSIVSQNLLDMLTTFIELQENVVAQNQHLFKDQKDEVDDEEILSDDEDIEDHTPDDADEAVLDSEESDDQVNEQPRKQSAPETRSKPQKRKITLDSVNSILQDNHEKIKKVRNEVMDEWYHSTLFTTGSNSKDVKKSLESAEQQPPSIQIQQIIANKKRLIRRTQLKRSDYKIIGKTVPETETEDTVEKREADYDAEIFDDDDFYHQMLRELIESKSSESTGSLLLSRKWQEIQKMRSKMKKKVDTRASKGRKIRFEIHKELVNLMAPVFNHEVTEESKDQLFKSLFHN